MAMIACVRGMGCLVVLAVVGCAPSAAGGDCAAALVPGDLAISEVFADFKATPGGTGNDAGKEWFEIYNAAGRPIDLAGLTITHSRPDGSKANAHVVAATVIAPGRFFTLGNAAPDRVPAYVDQGYGGDLGDLYNSGGGKLALSCGGVEIDSAVYDEVREGHARARGTAPDIASGDAPDSWCEAGDGEFEIGNFGTPGAANDCRSIAAGMCDDGAVRAIVGPAPGTLVISELLANPAGASDAQREWFEIANTGEAAFDLNGLAVGRIGAAATPVQATSCLSVPPGGFAVFARSADAAVNAMLPSVDATFRFALVDGGGDLQIADGNGVLDQVRWASATSGVSQQLDPARMTTADNDDAGAFCAATARYGDGTSTGTPGTANAPCP